MKAIRKESSLIPFHEVFIFEAMEDDEATFGSFVGDKLYWVNKGDRVRIRVKKSDCIEVGDDINLSWLVMKDQDKFSWDWESSVRARRYLRSLRDE